MRTRSALAVALLAFGPGAPAIADTIPAREVEFLEDPYWMLPGLAVRSIARGAIYSEFPGSFSGVPGYYVEYPEFGIKGYATPDAGPCHNFDQCWSYKGMNRLAHTVGGESFFVAFPPGGVELGWTKPFAHLTAGPFPLETQYLTPPPGYPAAPTGGAHAFATAINDGDLIAGMAKNSNPAVGYAPVWWPSPSAFALELPRLSGANSGPFPVHISDAGIIIGITSGSAPQRAAAWRPGYSGYILALLGELPGGTSSQAYDIGFFGGIVGSSDDGSGSQVAVIWRPNGVGYTVTPLPVPPDGSCSAATAINTNGDISGNCTRGDGAERGVVWRKVGGAYELLHELEPLPGYTRSVAYALDNDGQAGGGSGPQYAERAVLWPVVVAAPVSVPALSRVSLLCLVSVIAAATAAALRARRQPVL